MASIFFLVLKFYLILSPKKVLGQDKLFDPEKNFIKKENRSNKILSKKLFWWEKNVLKITEVRKKFLVQLQFLTWKRRFQTGYGPKEGWQLLQGKISHTSWANARVKLHSQVHIGLCCIRKPFGLKSRIQIFLRHNNYWVKKCLVKNYFGSQNIWVRELLDPKNFGLKM